MADPVVFAIVRDAMAALRRGDDAGARRIAEAGLLDAGPLPLLDALLGMLACRAGELEAGIAHLRRALDAEPGDAATRANLAQALVDSGRFDEAIAVATPAAAAADPSMRLWRIRGYAALESGRFDDAIAAYRTLVDADPRDAEGWNNLGNALAGAGETREAVTALAEAARLRPGDANMRRGHASAVSEAGDAAAALALLRTCVRDFADDGLAFVALGTVLGRLHRADEAVAAFERAIVLRPDDPAPRVRLGEQHGALFRPAAAEEAFRAALRLAPGDGAAHVRLALLYERANRSDDLDALVASAQVVVADPAVRAFVEALGHRRRGRFAEALAAMSRVPEDFEPGWRAQIVGQCEDRLGRADAAFAAFVAMNRRHAAEAIDPAGRAAQYRGTVRRAAARARARATAAPFRVPPGDPPAPVFLVGFPRSGTTLLDTMLMGHPRVTVMEELPVLRAAEEAAGSVDPATLDEAAIRAARRRYFEVAAESGGWRGDTLLIDKFPLHLAKAALIHRLFPDARFVLALRHPCDVVLSCYMTAFALNNAMANFLDLRTAAETYDLVLDCWERCRAALPLDVTTIRYEDVVADAPAALAPVLHRLGLDAGGIGRDHEATAAARGHIATASYAQVTEPIYARASGRWRRYERHLRPVLPILAPWVERLGYAP